MNSKNRGIGEAGQPADAHENLRSSQFAAHWWARHMQSALEAAYRGMKSPTAVAGAASDVRRASKLYEHDRAKFADEHMARKRSVRPFGVVPAGIIAWAYRRLGATHTSLQDPRPLRAHAEAPIEWVTPLVAADTRAAEPLTSEQLRVVMKASLASAGGFGRLAVTAKGRAKALDICAVAAQGLANLPAAAVHDVAAEHASVTLRNMARERIQYWMGANDVVLGDRAHVQLIELFLALRSDSLTEALPSGAGAAAAMIARKHGSGRASSLVEMDHQK